MLKKRMYKVLVKNWPNEYVLGRISGMIRAISETDRGDCIEFAQKGFPYSPSFRVLRFKTTYWRYRRIKYVLNKHYPDMCVFI